MYFVTCDFIKNYIFSKIGTEIFLIKEKAQETQFFFKKNIMERELTSFYDNGLSDI